MRIRVTKVYEKELIPAKREERDPETGRLLFDRDGTVIMEKTAWVDSSYIDADPDDYTQEKYNECGIGEAPTFPIIDPRDGVQLDRLDHTFNGYDLERDLDYVGKEVTWEVIDDSGLPYDPDSRVNQMLDAKEITSGEPKGWLSTSTPIIASGERSVAVGNNTGVIQTGKP